MRPWKGAWICDDPGVAIADQFKKGGKSMKLRKRYLVVLLAFGVMISLLALGQQGMAASKAVELKLWSAWPSKMDPAKPALQMLIDMINEKGKAVNLSVKYVGGPEVFGPFQGCESLQNGIVDMAYTAAAYNTGVIPEDDAMKLMETLPWDDRKNGAFDLLNKWHNEKNLEFLARAATGQGFQGYLNVDITKPDLTGITMRVAPIYVPLINALHAKAVAPAGGEVYTALERGTVQGFWWGGREIRTWGWNEVCKYIWGPPFWTVDVYVLMNKKKWDSLSAEQKKTLTALFKEYERKTYHAEVSLQGEITKDLLAKGMKEIKFSPEDQKWYINMAYTEGWKAALQKSPRVEELKKIVAKH
jgi:TRAP-type mannitol/chloroaromatic compound transport system substrate-binding protein